jgi:peptidoglycan/LPS O-acetylase OafA/YrhL
MHAYRHDIDGLRAISVIAVILFHFGYLPNGYLGVDVFFTISGFLITSIVYDEAVNGKFSIIQFYLRRIRRIIPLVLFTCLISLLIGVLVMLPDDLENLSQSVVATNLFANNILLLITTGNYWDVVNEYKPLMHTWSLGIEEQFYVFFPLIFMGLQGKRSRYILPVLVALTLISLILFMINEKDAVKFYSIQHRFYELSLGVIGAIMFRKKLFSHTFSIIILLLLIILLFFKIPFGNTVNIWLTISLSTLLLVSNNRQSKWVGYILENPLMRWVGKISFSLYMWHQIVLAFVRYAVLEEILWYHSIFIILFIFILSALSYYMIEQPFRNKKWIKTPQLLVSTFSLATTSIFSALFIYSNAGLLKDIPELGLNKPEEFAIFQMQSVKTNLHISYNARIYELNQEFAHTKKYQVLVIGNSFARDWSNVLLESSYGSDIEISYIYDLNNAGDKIHEKVEAADVIFLSEANKSILNQLEKDYGVYTAGCNSKCRYPSTTLQFYFVIPTEEGHRVVPV